MAVNSLTKLVLASTFCLSLVGVPFTASAQSGVASVYSGRHYGHGGGFTAAHRTLPFGTRVRVTNTRTHRSIIVRINDRGPFVRGRIIDLSRGAARALGFSGLAHVTVTVVGRGGI